MNKRKGQIAIGMLGLTATLGALTIVGSIVGNIYSKLDVHAQEISTNTADIATVLQASKDTQADVSTIKKEVDALYQSKFGITTTVTTPTK